MNKGKFVISLDFELMWGVRDKLTKQQYGNNIIGVWDAIPKMLAAFEKHNINATFSTVGFLFFNNKTNLLQNIPTQIPNYINTNLSPYHNYLETIGNTELEDKYHYATALINEIKKHNNHEIGTHTFSHYYCLEEGQTVNDFEADIIAAKNIATKQNINITSLVFPRNQFNESYLQVCKQLGIICYRGNEQSWLYKAKNGNNESLFRRACRLMDAYINLSGHNCYDENFLNKNLPINIPSSRFLRPYINKLKMLDTLRLKRIKSGMTYAAKNKLMYHLWWHPHNFGIHQTHNFLFLEKILLHYDKLNKQYGFESCTMSNLANQILAKKYDNNNPTSH